MDLQTFSVFKHYTGLASKTVTTGELMQPMNMSKYLLYERDGDKGKFEKKEHEASRGTHSMKYTCCLDQKSYASYFMVVARTFYPVRGCNVN